MCVNGQRGRKRDGHFNHKTDRGYVTFRKGQYHDAVTRLGSRITCMIIETTGALCAPARRCVAYHAARARGAGSRDGTTYGRSRASATSYYVHHVQQLARAAILGNVKGIHKCVSNQRQQLAAAAKRDDAARGAA